MFKFLELKSGGRRDPLTFHHLATYIEEGCASFVTTDERHLLRKEFRKSFEPHIKIIDPRKRCKWFLDVPIRAE